MHGMYEEQQGDQCKWCGLIRQPGGDKRPLGFRHVGALGVHHKNFVFWLEGDGKPCRLKNIMSWKFDGESWLMQHGRNRNLSLARGGESGHMCWLYFEGKACRIC